MQEVLEALQGVESAEVTLTPPEATVVYWPDQISGDDMLQALEETGKYTGEITGGDC